jgi:hypothetical protein
VKVFGVLPRLAKLNRRALVKAFRANFKQSDFVL